MQQVAGVTTLTCQVNFLIIDLPSFLECVEWGCYFYIVMKNCDEIVLWNSLVDLLKSCHKNEL